ncbi:hypothetical protein E0765_06130 [Sulfuricurvum sp. IAE1]|uniref:hypothetical protein n=1 Tax=Sulfuricurvum sp. IAE1 TaxID=2546102 RepID=UPI0010473B5F|nr:hypothetical protein [Sulfuricurvum sp. IAE1]TDA64290.1 hypothetical protein E0765_06130 [Sulfuricurvum sp. IAE1]
MLMTQAAFARKVKRSRQYINKLVKNGTIPTYYDGRVNMEEAERLMAEHEDPRRDGQREANAAKRSGGADLLSSAGSYPSMADMTEEEQEIERERLQQTLRDLQNKASDIGEEDETIGDIESMNVKQLNIAILKQDLRIKRAKADESEKMSVPIDEVRNSIFAASRIVRDGLLGIPARLAARIAAESDPHICRTMMEQEINRQLENLSGAFREL